MSMRGSGGEENCPKPPSGAEVRVSDETSRSSPPAAITAAQRCEVSPLLGVFTSKEIVPRVLEYEKALLVMKEHDYAKAGERQEVLKLSSLLAEMAPPLEESREPADPLADINTLLNSRKELLLFRQSLGKREDSLVSDHLREVVGMQIELIREQQEQLHIKDKELNTVRKDKEQLQARLERMERRLAILQKNSRSRYDTAEADSPLSAANDSGAFYDGIASGTPRMRRRHRDSLVSSEKPRSRSNSNDRVAGRGGGGRSSRVSSHSGTPIPQDVQEVGVGGPTKRNAKRKLSDNLVVETSVKKRRGGVKGEVRTRVEYEGLNLACPRQARDWTDGQSCDRPPLPPMLPNHLCRGSRRNSAEQANSVAASPSSGHSDATGHGAKPVVNGTDSNTILVPSWRTHLVKPGVDVDASLCEELTDEAFLRRHRKPEEDEKRRKRWDIQRTRTLRNHEELLRKYNQKGGGGEKTEKKKEKITTLLPKLSEVESLEIKDTVPVSAFGAPLPQLKSKEFQLPWFDLDAREARENARTTRSRARGSTSRQSVGSEADEDAGK